MEDFDFNIPKKVNLLNEDEDMDIDDYFTLRQENSEKKLSPPPQNKSLLESAGSPSVRRQTPKASPKPVRQSPRLVECKVLKSPLKNSGGRRRSLSESNIAPKLSKVGKNMKSSVLSMKAYSNKTCLNEDDKNNIRKIATVKGGLEKPTTTKTKEFKFSTDSRVKPRKRSMSSGAQVKEFAKSLRDCASKSKNQHTTRGTTKVKAFNLHDPKPAPTSEPFVSMAEKGMNYWKKTPQRFRSKVHFPEPDSKPKNEVGVTIPHTPKLSTGRRTRSVVDIPTREEIEQKELEEALKNKFRAQPLNKKIFNAPSTIPATRKATVPQPFDITDEKKEAYRQILKACESATDISTSSIPFNGVPTNLTTKKATQPKPFSFHDRDNQTMIKKQQKILKVIEEEKKLAEFQAQPLPVFEGGVAGLPKKKTPMKTKPKPFNLRSDDRGLTKQQHIKSELEEQERLDAEQRRFKAQSDCVLFKEPFVPEKSKKPLTDISTFTLNTEKRSEERHNFDVHLKEKEDQMAAKKKENEELLKAEEEAEIQRLRREVVHKAQPVKKFKPVEVKHGLLPPTVPISPDFATDSRLATRAASKRNLNEDSSDATFSS